MSQTANTSSQGPTGQSMDAQEVLKFEAMAAEWWDPDGSSAALHTMNPLRTQFARNAICLAHGYRPCYSHLCLKINAIDYA